MTIQPTAVYPPGTSPAPPAGGQPTYVLYPAQPPRQPRNPVTRTYNAIPGQTQTVSNIPGSKNLPYWLRGSLNNRAIVFNMWIIAMVVVGFDEWHNLNILPRPQRLWDTSLLYGLLAMLGFVDAMVPIANVLAIGFTITLLWQYFQGDITPQGGSGTASSGPNNAGAAPTATGA